MTAARFRLPLLFSASCLLACGTGPAIAPGSADPVIAAMPTPGGGAGRASPAAQNTGLDIRLHRSGCFGRCPSYSVRIRADDSVEFSAERFTAATGVQQGTALPSKLQALRDLLRQPGIASLNGDYTTANTKNCGRWATDFPSVTIEIMAGAFPRRIEHYLGCEGAPKALYALEQAIDEAAGSDRWIGAAARE
ncbi:MAG: hypothetical protein NVS9B10_19750 [Nevskia sp.]